MNILYYNEIYAHDSIKISPNTTLQIRRCSDLHMRVVTS